MRLFKLRLSIRKEYFEVTLGLFVFFVTAPQLAFSAGSLVRPPVNSGVSEIVFSGSGLGSSPTAPKNQAQQVSDSLIDPVYGKNEHAVFYGRANENISLQVATVLKKVEFLGDALKNSPDDIDQKKEILRGYCRDTDYTDYVIDDLSDPDHFDACRDKYITDKKLWLSKAGSAIGKNKISQQSFNSLMSLKCSQGQVKGQSKNCTVQQTGTLDPSSRVFSVGVDPHDQNPKKSPVEYLSKSSDIARVASSQVGSLQNIQDRAPESESEMLASLKPSRDDFVLFHDIQDPLSGKPVKVPESDANGNFKYNDAAYQKALKEWYLRNQDAPAPDPSHKAQERQAMQQAALDEFKQFQADFPSQPNPSQTGGINRQLFQQARGEFVDEINDFTVRGPQGGTNGSKAQHRTISTTGSGAFIATPGQANSANSQSYTGEEDVKPSLGSSPQEAETHHSVTYSPDFHHQFFK